VLRSSSDRLKIAVSLCAIASSAMTLAAYFSTFDLLASRLTRANTHAAGSLDAGGLSDAAVFPPGLAELTNAPTASS